MLYILGIEPNSDLQELMELGLIRSFPHELIFARSLDEARDIVLEKGRPEVIICDDDLEGGAALKLPQWISDLTMEVPYVICARRDSKDVERDFPEAYGIISIPHIGQPLQEMVADLLAAQRSLLTYVPVSVSLLLRLGKIDFNLYMKLSYSKYVKVLKEGDSFIVTDADRFREKQVTHLYLTAQDADKFIASFEQGLGFVLASDDAEGTDVLPLALESLEVVDRLAYSFGWTPAVLESAKRSVQLAMKVVAKDPNILKILSHKLKNGTAFSRHTSQLAMVTCCLSQQLGWTSEASQMKLAIAALMHDLAVNEEVYMGLNHWNTNARDSKVQDPETLQYRNHPVEAVTMLRNIKNLPPDIDHIILQHHEAVDGLGFPYRLSPGRISPLSCVFIFAEDMVNFLDEDDVTASLTEFLWQRQGAYDNGLFKKIFDLVASTLEA